MKNKKKMAGTGAGRNHDTWMLCRMWKQERWQECRQ